ncbi:MotA/TolQ/ExbB proton channel family protein [Endozoicomonadaceae bacterium StTr2]
MNEILQQLGMLSWPLMIASVISLALILERTVAFALLPSLGKKQVKSILQQIQGCDCKLQCEKLQQGLCASNNSLGGGVSVLLSHAGSDKGLREEVAGLWLLKQKQRLNANLKVLMLVGVLSPMLGLLGTILGMITMFQGLAASTGPITPAVLADGLWGAMYTTAFGLIVAIPSLAASHCFGIFAGRYLARLEFVLNHVNLLMEGISMEESGMARKSSAAHDEQQNNDLRLVEQLA